jgi:hypothetical protein
MQEQGTYLPCLGNEIAAIWGICRDSQKLNFTHNSLELLQASSNMLLLQ